MTALWTRLSQYAPLSEPFDDMITIVSLVSGLVVISTLSLWCQDAGGCSGSVRSMASSSIHSFIGSTVSVFLP